MKEVMPGISAESELASRSVAPVGTILVVEDPLVSKLVRAVLRRHGYDVTVVTEGDAKARLQTADSGIGVLLTNAPGAFLEFGDRVPLLYLSSSPDIFLQASFRHCRVVVKPFVPDDLVQAVGALTRKL